VTQFVSTDGFGVLAAVVQAIEIGGEHYGDGGYMGNPAMFPFDFQLQQSRYHTYPHQSAPDTNLPRTAAENLNRINEIGFNSSLIRDRRVMHFVARIDP